MPSLQSGSQCREWLFRFERLSKLFNQIIFVTELGQVPALLSCPCAFAAAASAAAASATAFAAFSAAAASFSATFLCRRRCCCRVCARLCFMPLLSLLLQLPAAAALTDLLTT